MSEQMFRDQFLAKFGTLVLYTPTGKEVVAAIGSRVATIQPSGKHIGDFKEHTDDVFTIAATRDGHILSGSRDGTIRLWRVSDHKQVAMGQPGGLVTAVAASPSGRQFVSCSGGAPTVWWLDKPTGLFAKSSTLRPMATLDSPAFGPLAPRSLAFSPDGEFLAVGSTDGVEIWRTMYWTKETVMMAGWPTSIAFSDSGSLIAAADHNSIQIWSMARNFEKVVNLDGHRKAVNCVAFSPSGRHLVSCGEDGQIIIWRTSDGRRVETHDAERQGLRYFSVAIAPALDWIVARHDRADVIFLRVGDLLRV